MKYRKKPQVVEALRWTGDNLEEIREFVGVERFDPTILRERHAFCQDHLWLWNSKELSHFFIPVGHWVIKGVEGEYFPCAPDVFKDTYDPVDS